MGQLQASNTSSNTQPPSRCQLHITMSTNVAAEDYNVKSINGVKKTQGKISYLVKWAPTWEREDQLIGCETLIEIYKDSQKSELYGYAVKKNAPKDGPAPLQTSKSSSSKKKSSGSYALNKEQFSKKKSSGSYKKGDQQKQVESREEKENESSKNMGCASGVTAVTGIFHGKDDYVYYMVEWEATWESEENLAGCEDLVRDFFKKELGMMSMAGEMATDELIEVKEEPASPQPYDYHQDTNHNSNAEIEHLKDLSNLLKEQNDSLKMKFEETKLKLEILDDNFAVYKKDKEAEIDILLQRNQGVREKLTKLE